MFGTVNNESWTLTILGVRDMEDMESASKFPGVIESFIAWKIVYPRRIPTLVLILFQLSLFVSWGLIGRHTPGAIAILR